MRRVRTSLTVALLLLAALLVTLLLLQPSPGPLEASLEPELPVRARATAPPPPAPRQRAPLVIGVLVSGPELGFLVAAAATWMRDSSAPVVVFCVGCSAPHAVALPAESPAVALYRMLEHVTREHDPQLQLRMGARSYVRVSQLHALLQRACTDS